VIVPVLKIIKSNITYKVKLNGRSTILIKKRVWQMTKILLCTVNNASLTTFEHKNIKYNSRKLNCVPSSSGLLTIFQRVLHGLMFQQNKKRI
jgi:hypothetical protein